MKLLKNICTLVILILLSSCIFTDDKEREVIPEVLLSHPKPYSPPQDDYEHFFNYCLASFVPKTEPLIKETFGNTLRIEPAGFWAHPSYTSLVVGFATNIPSVSIVEYGRTVLYGQYTQMSDSYYYKHLHYIRGLEPGVTYHYRIRAMDGEGGEVVSGDFMFTLPQIPSDAIRIPDDMPGDPPYNLTQGGALYVLTCDLTVPTLAINIKAHNVTIDLDGHTITYDTQTPKVIGNTWNDYAYSEEATFGIRAGLWNFSNAKIFNGVIKQGDNGGSGFIGIGFNPIFLNLMTPNTNNEVAGVTIDYYGNSVSGIYAGNGKVHHNVIIDRGSVIDNRHQGIRAVELGNLTTNEVAWNSIRRFRHQGLYSAGRILNNELYSDSFDTNSFMIGPGDGATVNSNKLFGMGYNPIGIGWANNIIVRNNFIYLRGYAPTLRSTEYDRKSAVAGLRTTNYGEDRYDYMLYEDNVIIVKAEDGCTLARGIWTTNGINDKRITYRRNTVKAEAMPDNVTITDNPYYNGDVYNAICAVTFSGAQLLHPSLNPALPDPVIFEDNRLIGNVNLVIIGEGYGITSSVWMYRTKLEKIEQNSEYFRPIRLGFWNLNTFNNRMIDTEVVNISAAEMTPHFYGSAGFMEVTYGIAREVTVTGNGEPIKSSVVTISIDGIRTFTGTTDSNGKLRLDLLTVQHSKDGETVSKTDYQQYTFTVAGYPPLTLTASQLMYTTVIPL